MPKSIKESICLVFRRLLQPIKAALRIICKKKVDLEMLKPVLKMLESVPVNFPVNFPKDGMLISWPRFHCNDSEVDKITRQIIDEEIKKIIDKMREKTKHLSPENNAKIDKQVELLMEKETVSSEEIQEILREHSSEKGKIK